MPKKKFKQKFEIIEDTYNISSRYIKNSVNLDPKLIYTSVRFKWDLDYWISEFKSKKVKYFVAKGKFEKDLYAIVCELPEYKKNQKLIDKSREIDDTEYEVYL